MSRQLELQAEVRESKRRDALIRCVEFGLVGALQTQGIHLDGLAVTFKDWECFMVLKVTVEERRMVSFVASDTFANTLLMAERMAAGNNLRYKVDVFAKEGSGQDDGDAIQSSAATAEV